MKWEALAAAFVWSSNWIQTPPFFFYCCWKMAVIPLIVLYLCSASSQLQALVCGMLQMLEYAQDLIQKQGMTETEVTITVSTAVWWCTNVVEPTARDQPSWAVLLVSALSIKWQSSEGKLWWCLNGKGGWGERACVWTWRRLTAAFSHRLGVWEFVRGSVAKGLQQDSSVGVSGSWLAARQKCRELVVQGLQRDGSVGS